MCVQEEITQGVVSLSVETGKMTADLLQKAVKKVLEEMQKKPSQRSLHQGKQTLHQLKQHGASLTNIEITEQNIKAFSAVANMASGEVTPGRKSSAPKRPIRREKFRAGAACRQTGGQETSLSCGAHGSAAKKRRISL